MIGFPCHSVHASLRLMPRSSPRKRQIITTLYYWISRMKQRDPKEIWGHDTFLFVYRKLSRSRPRCIRLTMSNILIFENIWNFTQCPQHVHYFLGGINYLKPYSQVVSFACPYGLCLYPGLAYVLGCHYPHCLYFQKVAWWPLIIWRGTSRCHHSRNKIGSASIVSQYHWVLQFSTTESFNSMHQH